MNLLAHALLAGADDDVRFGSMIGDFVRGTIDPTLPEGVREGIALHRAVDAYTDAHSEVVAARMLFEPPYRRYAGILLDVWFDHLLARDWSRHATGTLHAFSHGVQALLRQRAGELPPRMRGFAAYLHRNDLPEAYRERAMIGVVLHGLSQRLSRENPLAQALPVIETHAALVQQHFDRFLPALIAFAQDERRRK